MAALKAFICIASVFALVQVTMSIDYTVGGPTGSWDAATDLKTWATNQKFTAGDSLIFKYQASHDVLEVSKASYDACTAVSPLASYTGGSTTVKLAAPGKRYFICGVPGHCAAGMKLEVDVVSTAVATPPAASPPLPPSKHHEKSLPPSPSPSPASDSIAATPASEFPVEAAPASPPEASAAAGLGRWGQVAWGIWVMVVTVLAL
ncbi:uclacyanin 1-like [Typha angustifolia]|uniref:uclacyanin 1-like n=1 Tax=Typha angustifolia TaxID=59011 RepID=UPI003C2BF503